MGTYTTNKELYMPTVGEQGWGTLVNENFETIDNFLKPITESNGAYTFTGNQTGGSISATSITNSGTLTSTGKITANGGIGTTTLTTSSTITSTGKITGNGGIGTTSLTTSSTITSTGKITANGGIGTKALTATSISNSGNMTNTGTLTCTGKIYANGGIEGVTTLDKVVTVAASDIKITHDVNGSGIDITPLCAYVPGVLYTGYINVGTSYVYEDYYVYCYTLSSSNVWTKNTVKPTSTSTPKSFNFTNIKCLMVQFSSPHTESYYYLPIFS